MMGQVENSPIYRLVGNLGANSANTAIHMSPHAGPLLDASRAMQSTKPPGSRLRPPPAADALEKVGFVSKGDKQYVKHAKVSLGAVLTWVSQTTRLSSAARILWPGRRAVLAVLCRSQRQSRCCASLPPYKRLE